MIGGFLNIFTSPDVRYRLGIGADIVRQGIEQAAGLPVLTITTQKPGGATVTTQTAVNAEKRAQLQPLGILPTFAPAARAAAGIPAATAPKRSAVDRRSVPRPERDPRMPKDEKTEAIAPGSEKRTGGPLSSLWTELKSLVRQPAGIAVLTLIGGGFVFALVRAVRR